MTPIRPVAPPDRSDPARPEPAPAGAPRRPRGVAGWVLSVLVHVLLVAVLASVVWTVVDEAEPERFVTLVPARAGLEDAASSSQPGASGGAPSVSDPSDEARSDAMSAPMPTIPAPSAADASGAVAAAPSVTADATETDPAFAVLATLAETASATRPTGAGANPLLDGTSAGFRELVGGISGQGLDVVLVLDATESMGPSIAQAKQRLRDVVAVITGVLSTDGSPPDNVRFGAVAFKDYGDDYGVGAVRTLPLNDDPEALHAFLDQTFVGGGGDVPEPVHEALDAATDPSMGWRPRTRNVIVLVGDAPIHPSGRDAATATVRRFARRLGGTVSVIDVGLDRRSILEDFGRLAVAGNGSASRLEDEEGFWRALIVSIFGARFERDVDQIVERYGTQRPRP